MFLGLWLFGWERLSKRVHLATIWAVAVGGVGSAAFIMAANSWMQRPVGYQLNGGRAQLTDTASSPYALKVMTVAAAVLFPVVLAYQAWSYHVFRNRVR